MKKDPSSLRIAHLSDPHFSEITWSPKQYLSKRWIGNWNLILFRKKAYQTHHLAHVPELIETLEVEYTFITGDFSSTSLSTEFERAQSFVKSFKQPVYVLPGNHDCYTKGAQRAQRFYDFFLSEGLKKDRIEKASLGKGWWWVGLDCTIATPPLCAYGRFFPEMEEKLEKVLSEIPKDERVILGNHFPLFTAGRPSHDLSRAKRLQEILRNFPQVKLYLHGHDHKPYIIDNKKPLVFNSGSAAHQPDGTFYLFDLYETECLVERLLFRKVGGEFSWIIDWQKHYTF